ncbi:MAG: carbohydrate ABC transporter substrate-binding protein [Clostridiales bacterium]|nr:carbohydrate ABC transporter substrate-binding protein [Clostridiales bacterium]
MKKRVKIASLLCAVVLMTGSLFGCAKSGSSTSSSGSGNVTITFLNSKGEIADTLKQAVAEYNKTNKDGITVELSTIGAGGSAYEALMAKYSSGNAPTISMLGAGDIISFQDKAADLSGEKWVSDISNGMIDPVKLDGKIYAFPFAVEGCGLIYNKTTIEKATGTTFDPTAIKTRSDLEALYKKIQAGGVTPVEISKDDWSLGDHFMMSSYSAQNSSYEKVQSFVSGMKAGTQNLADNKTFNGILDTLDLNMKYNIYKNSPLSSDYSSTDPQNIADGKVAFWFNGEWTWPNIKQFLTANSTDEFGFLPVFVSDNASDYGNSQIPVGVTKFLMVDQKQNSAAQQAAAKKFLNWFVYDSKGQDYLVNKMGIIPAFKNITSAPDDSLSKSIKSYLDNNKTMYFNASLPSDHGSKVGGFMQQYLAGKIDRKNLAAQIEAYWKGTK